MTREQVVSRTLGYCTLLALLATHATAAGQPAGASRESAPQTQATTGISAPAKTSAPLVVIGFQPDAALDPRDAWTATAVEETLAWRLGRVPALTVPPTVRTHQARRELAEGDEDPPAEWARVVRLLGAKHWLKGTCTGRPGALNLELELIAVDVPDAEPVTVELGPARLFDVIDDATRWTLGQLDVPRISVATAELVFAPPAASPGAVEYYAKAVSAAQAGKLRDVPYYLERALDYDRAFCPALLLLAKIELRGTALPAAATHLRRVKLLAADRGDAVSESEFERSQGLLLMMTRSFEPARKRFESALAIAFACNDTYGQLAAMNGLCDYWCNRQPPAQAGLPTEAQ